MSHNPYAPPKADVGGPTAAAAAAGVPHPVEQLYSPNQIAIGAFLGTPLAAGWLAAHNYRAMRQPREAGRVLGLGIIATIVVMAIAYYLPDSVPSVVFPIAYCVAIYQAADSKFKAVVAAHRTAGGTMRSSWRVVGIGLLCALIVVAVMFGILLQLIE
jgi:hypothetical protein